MVWPVSAAFVNALTASHKISTRADLCNQQGTVLVGSIPVKEGTITIDRTAAIRRSCDVTLVGNPALIPLFNSNSSALAPYGNELRLYRGVTYPNGSTEVCPLGVFRVSLVDITDAADQFEIEVTGYDRSRMVARAKLPDLFPIPQGTDFGNGIKSLIRPSLPAGQAFNFTPSGFTTPSLLFEADDDRWDESTQMAQAIGGRLWFDQVAVCQLAPVPDSAALIPVRSYVEGPGCTMTEVERTLDDQDTYNHIVIQGEGTGVTVPLRSECWDNRPASPTALHVTSGPFPGRGAPPAVDGMFGDACDVQTTNLVTTQAQADTAATAALLDSLGLTEGLTVTAIPDPSLDADDVILCTRARSGVNAAYIVDSITLPLGPHDLMTVTTRARRV